MSDARRMLELGEYVIDNFSLSDVPSGTEIAWKKIAETIALDIPTERAFQMLRRLKKMRNEVENMFYGRKVNANS